MADEAPATPPRKKKNEETQRGTIDAPSALAKVDSIEKTPVSKNSSPRKSPKSSPRKSPRGTPPTSPRKSSKSSPRKSPKSSPKKPPKSSPRRNKESNSVDDEETASVSVTEVISNQSSSSNRSTTPKRATSSSAASSAATRLMLRNRTKERSHDRVAGGAAAKLIGPPSPTKYATATAFPNIAAAEEGFQETESDQADPNSDAESEGLEKIDKLREKAKEEWKKGTEENKRYLPPQPQPEDNFTLKADQESLPAVLKRNEALYGSASAAVLSLLAPSRRVPDSSVGGSTIESIGSTTGEDVVIVSSPEKAKEQASIPRGSAFRGPFSEENASTTGSVAGKGGGSVAGNGAGAGKNSFSVQANVEVGERVTVLDTSFGSSRPPALKPLLSNEAEEQIEILKVRMQDPSRTLADLLTAICSPSDGKEMERGYMVRRKNACGALKVLTAKPENRRTICWTVGVLPALTSVLEDSGDEGVMVTFPDAATRFEYEEARKRAVANLLNLAMPKENRCAVFHSPGLVKALIKTISEDDGESRQGCCAILAYLARTVENRILMVHVPDLIDSITNVINPNTMVKKDDVVREFLSSALESIDTCEEGSEGSESDEEKNDSMLTDDTGSEGGSDAGSDLGSEVGTDGDDASTGTDNVDTSFDEADAKSEFEDSDGTPLVSPSSSPLKSPPPVRTSSIYDLPPDVYLESSRQYVYAMLSHLVKEKDNAFHLARHENLILALVTVSKLHDDVSQKHAVMTLACLTRHRDNSKWMVFRLRSIVPALVTATYSGNDKSRKYACYGLQNLAQEKACRQEIANTDDLLVALCKRARYAIDDEEKLAAINTLKNLTDEPANLVPMTNAPECLATFMQIAHGKKDDTTEMMQYKACDGLATLSHWLRKIATSGQVIETVKSKAPKSRELFVPSLKVVTWNQWE